MFIKGKAPDGMDSPAITISIWVDPKTAADKAAMRPEARCARSGRTVASPLKRSTVGRPYDGTRRGGVFHEVFGHRAKATAKKDVNEDRRFRKK